MNTISSPKKALFVAIFLILATFSGTSRVEAQVTSSELQAQLDTLKAQLIEMLLAQIAQLQAQIATLSAQQVQTQEVVATIQEQTAPILGSSELETTISIGKPVCYANLGSKPGQYDYIHIPVNVSGDWTSGKVEYSTYQLQNNQPLLTQAKKVTVTDISPKTPYVRVKNYDDSYVLNGTLMTEEGSVRFMETVNVLACQ